MRDTEPDGSCRPVTGSSSSAVTVDVDAVIDSSVSPLEISSLTVAYDHKPVLWQLDYTAPRGALIAIIGPNGAGKSTLLKAVMGLIPALSGRVRIYGHKLAQCRQLVSYVPQRESVDWDFPACALDVVVMGLYGQLGWFRPVRRRHREQAICQLEQLGMAEFAYRQIGQLSGGQQQRVFLARALIQQAWLYLMDEPFAGIDAATEQVILSCLRQMRQQGRTVICVHHDLHSAREYFEQALLLNVCKLGQGPVASVLDDEHLRAAYGKASKLIPTSPRTGKSRSSSLAASTDFHV